MGISWLSALTIANSPVVAIAAGPNSEGKFQGIIAHGEDHPHHPYLPILSTTFMYDSAEVAKTTMEKQIRIIRESVAQELDNDIP